MRIRCWIGIATAGIVALTLSSAQPPPGATPRYDPKAEVVVKGKVTAVAAIPDWMGKKGVNVTLQTPDAVTVHVDIAPEEFLQMLDFAIASGDELEITGVWVEWDGSRVLLAKTVTHHKVAVSFRDPEGRPVW